MTVCSYGSGLLFALHAGVIGDRFNRKLVMVGSDLCRAQLMGLLAWQAAVGAASLLSMCLIALSVGLLNVVFDSAAAAALPDLVGEKLHARAMARNQSRDFALAMIGPVLGSALFTVGPAWAFTLDAGSYVVSAVLLGFVTTRLMPGADRSERGTLAMIRDGIGCVAGEPRLARLTLYLSVLNLILTATIFAINVQEHERPFLVGVAFAAQAVGGLLGSVFAERLHRRLSATALVCLHGGLWLAGLTAMGLAPTAPVIAVGLGLGWLLAPALRLAFGSHLVSVVPPDMRARANSAVSLSTSSFSLLGPPIAGAALGMFGFGGTMVSLGLVVLLVVGVITPSIHSG